MTGKQRAAALLCGGWLAVCAGWSARAAEPSSPQVGPLEYEAAVQPVMDNASYTHFLLDQFEGRFGGSGPEGRWDAQGWWGNDYDKFWVKTEGTLTDGRVEDGTSRRCAGWG